MSGFEEPQTFKIKVFKLPFGVSIDLLFATWKDHSGVTGCEVVPSSNVAVSRIEEFLLEFFVKSIAELETLSITFSFVTDFSNFVEMLEACELHKSSFSWSSLEVVASLEFLSRQVVVSLEF